MLEKLESSLCRTKRLTLSVHDEIDELKHKNSSLRRSSNEICVNLEITLDDAKETQRELQKIEKMFRNKCHKC